MVIADKWCVDINHRPFLGPIGGAEWKKDEITEPKKEKSLLTHISKCIRQGERKIKTSDDKKHLTESEPTATEFLIFIAIASVAALKGVPAL